MHESALYINIIKSTTELPPPPQAAWKSQHNSFTSFCKLLNLLSTNSVSQKSLKTQNVEYFPAAIYSLHRHPVSQSASHHFVEHVVKICMTPFMQNFWKLLYSISYACMHLRSKMWSKTNLLELKFLRNFGIMPDMYMGVLCQFQAFRTQKRMLFFVFWNYAVMTALVWVSEFDDAIINF